MAATHPLSSLLSETLSSILDHLSREERMCLAEACHSIRQRLLPFLYNTLTFSNSSIMSNPALLAAQSHGKYVKNLRFIGYSYKSDDHSDTDLWKRPITRRDGSILHVPYCNIPGLDQDTDGSRGGAAEERDSEEEHDSEEERREEQEDEDWLDELWEDWSSRCISLWGSYSGRLPRDYFPQSAMTLFLAAHKRDKDGLLPNLETFSIHFSHDYSQQADFLPFGADGMFEDLEQDWRDVAKLESNFTMCRVWRNTFHGYRGSGVSLRRSWCWKAGIRGRYRRSSLNSGGIISPSSNPLR